jgi:hypothetical protein
MMRLSRVLPMSRTTTFGLARAQTVGTSSGAADGGRAECRDGWSSYFRNIDQRNEFPHRLRKKKYLQGELGRRRELHTMSVTFKPRFDWLVTCGG